MMKGCIGWSPPNGNPETTVPAESLRRVEERDERLLAAAGERCAPTACGRIDPYSRSLPPSGCTGALSGRLGGSWRVSRLAAASAKVDSEFSSNALIHRGHSGRTKIEHQ
jgi:hypothetical protein